MENLVISGLSTYVTWSICGIIFIIFSWSYYRRRSISIKNVSITPVLALAPGAVITLGIFGTFLGIYIGLINFDTTDINNSIPDLLEGLKTAFITSLFGIIFSLFLKYIFGEYDKKDIEKESTASDDPLVLLRQISTGVKSLSGSVTSMTTAILRCFQSDEEFSFISQIKIIRTDINDLKREIIKSLDEFGKKVAELGTEAMIDALKQVIEQFNAHLNDLVGEEFKQLRDAMIKLVEWQENHRRSVDEMQNKLSKYVEQVERSAELLNKVSNSMEMAAGHLDSIDGSMSTISVSAEDIENHIEKLKLQNENLKVLIESVKEMGEKAKDVLPSISKHIEESTTNLNKTSEQLVVKVEAIGKSLEDSVKKTGERMEGLTELHSKQVKEASNQIESNLETVLTQSLTSLGGQLAALSNKFVDDYTPLTEKLRKIVRIAEEGGNVS